MLLLLSPYAYITSHFVRCWTSSLSFCFFFFFDFLFGFNASHFHIIHHLLSRTRIKCVRAAFTPQFLGSYGLVCARWNGCGMSDEIFVRRNRRCDKDFIVYLSRYSIYCRGHGVKVICHVKSVLYIYCVMIWEESWKLWRRAQGAHTAASDDVCKGWGLRSERESVCYATAALQMSMKGERPRWAMA